MLASARIEAATAAHFIGECIEALSRGNQADGGSCSRCYPRTAARVRVPLGPSRSGRRAIERERQTSPMRRRPGREPMPAPNESDSDRAPVDRRDSTGVLLALARDGDEQARDRSLAHLIPTQREAVIMRLELGL